jgi:CRISPR-associated protein Cas2
VSRNVLVCYDICEPRRLKRVHKVVRDFGVRVQYSVYACRLRERDRAELQARLLDVIDRTVDQVMFIDLGPVGTSTDLVPGAQVIGRPSSVAIGTSVVV